MVSFEEETFRRGHSGKGRAKITDRDILDVKTKSKVCCLYTTPQWLKHSLGCLKFNYAGYTFPTTTTLEGWKSESTFSQLPVPVKIKLRS